MEDYRKLCIELFGTDDKEELRRCRATSSRLRRRSLRMSIICENCGICGLTKR